MYPFKYKINKVNYLFSQQLEHLLQEVLSEINCKKMAKTLEKIYTQILINSKPKSHINFQKIALKVLQQPELTLKIKHTNHIPLLIGEYVYQQIYKKVTLDTALSKYFPFNDILFKPSIGEWEIVLRALNSEKLSRGNVWFSNQKPKLTYDNKEYTIVYSKHSIEQLSMRYRGQIINQYGSLADVFDALYGATYFPIATLLNGAPAIVVYDRIQEESMEYQFLQNTYKKLGKEVHPDKFYYCKIGYYPIEFEDNYAICTSFLSTGFKKTPEYKSLKSNFYDSQHFNEFENLHTSEDAFLENILQYRKTNQIKNLFDLFYCTSPEDFIIESEEHLFNYGIGNGTY